MDLDQLKSTWKTLDDKLAATYRLNEQMARALLNDRSRGAIASIRQDLRWAALFFAALFSLFCVILLTNPFDYTTWVAFVPGILYSLLVAVVLLLIAVDYNQMQTNELVAGSLRESLTRAVYQHERYLKLMGRIWQISLLLGLLLGVSLSARNFNAYSVTKSVLLVGGQVLTGALLYWVAKRVLGRSPNQHLSRLKAHLRELDELDGL